MSEQPGLDPSKPDLVPEAGVRLTPVGHNDPNELTELAARFASRANGGLSPELSAELALEILLNEIAEQACAATGETDGRRAKVAFGRDWRRDRAAARRGDGLPGDERDDGSGPGFARGFDGGPVGQMRADAADPAL